MDAAGLMGRGTRRAGRMCGLKRRALVTFACVALAVFLAASYMATREDRGAARLTRAPQLRERRADGGTAEGDAWLEEWQKKHGVDTRLAHETRARAEHDEEMASEMASGYERKSPPRARHVVAAGKHHNKRYSLRGFLGVKEHAGQEGPIDVEEDPLLSAALKAMRLPPGSLVALTFADKKMLAMVLNWSAHLKHLNVPHLVGALDDHTQSLLESRDVRAFRCVLSHAEELDGGSSHDSGNWKTFAKMRIAKVRAALELGYDVLMSDADVVWRRDPRHYLQCPEMAVDDFDGSDDASEAFASEGKRKRSPCESIAAADVMVSSDNLSPKTDAKQGASYARGGVFNTGVVFLKHTNRAKAFAKAWSWHLSATPDSENSRFATLTSDQQVFNAMTRRVNEWPGIDPVDHHTEVPDLIDVPTRVLEASLGLPTDVSGSEAQNTDIFDGFESFALGVLPVAAFQPGHVAFLQRVDEMDKADVADAFEGEGDDGEKEDSENNKHPKAPRNNEPYCVHATYTFDGSTALAKRFRFAEFGLWDPESDRVSPNNNGVFREDDDASFAFAESQKKFLTYDPLSSLETVFETPFETFNTFQPAIGRHLTAGTTQLRALRDAMAIAKVLNRTLAVPAPFCFCDKVWGGHDNIFTFNCHYPGSADSGHMPGTCPLDHFVSPTAMRNAGVDFVAHGELPFFLEKTDTVLEVVSGADAIEEGGVDAGAASHGLEKDSDKDSEKDASKKERRGKASGSVSIPAFATETQIRDALERRGKSLRDAKLVRLSNALDAFGGFDDDETEFLFESVVEKALKPETWCSECHPKGCKALIDSETLKLGTLHVVREVHDQFCATFEKPKGFRKVREEISSDDETIPIVSEVSPRTESTKTSSRLHDADGDDSVFSLRTPGSPPADDEIAAAGW